MTRRHSSGHPRLILGLFLILLGLGKLLDNLGFLRDIDVGDYWPLLLVAVGIGRLVSGDLLRGLFVTALGVVFLLPTLVPSITWRDLFDQWPLFVIAVGAMLVLRSLLGQDGEGVPVVTRDQVDAFGFLNTYRRAVENEAFRGGELGAFLGGCEIDLRDAELAPGGAVIDVFAFWGGITVRVPRHWLIDLRVLPVMGGAEDKTKQQRSEGGPCLVIRGFVMMGGVEIGN